MYNRLKIFTTILVLLFAINFSTYAEDIKRYNVGFFEAGQYDVHEVLRDEYSKQLEMLLPDSVQIVAIPEGYRSAEWNRENSKKMAKQLVDIKHLDFVVAVGPWVVQDLLDAGFKKPIIGMHQFNPKADGFLGKNDRPIADNLTVHFRPGKAIDDISTLAKLLPLKKLGLLYFPSEDNSNSFYNHIKSLGDRFGFEVVTATAYDNEGTYAFFKSYNKIKKQRVDALYLSPLWGLNSSEISEFFQMLDRDKVPTFTDEGSILIQKGATATNNYYGVVSEAYFNAFKTVEILNGAVPADLPVIFRGEYHVAINKLSAQKCGLELRADIFNSYQLIGEENNEHLPVSTLSEVVNLALNQNPLILSHFDKLDAADAKVAIAKSTLKPQIYGEAQLDYLDDNYRHNYQYNIEKEALRTSLNFSQTLFSKEKLKEIKSTKEIKKIVEINKLTTQLDLELAVSQAYVDYLKIKEQGKIINNIRSMVSYNLEILHAKQLLNNPDSLDYLRLDNYRYNLTLAYIKNHRDLQTAQVLLNSLLNLPPETEFLLQEDYFSEDKFIQFESPVIGKLLTHSSQEKIGNKLLDKILKQNPNQLKSDMDIAYNKTLLDKNKSSFYPEVSLQGSLYYNDFQKESDLFQTRKQSWYVGGKVTLPIYLGGKRFKEKKQALARISESEYLKDVSSLAVMQIGLANYHNFVQYTEQMTPAYQAKQRAYSTLQIANENFNKSTLSTTDFLEILQTTLETDIQSIEIRYNYFSAMAKIVHSLGIPVSDSYTDFVNQFHSELEY